MRILDDEKVFDFLDAENGGSHSISNTPTQIKITQHCSCIVTVDKKGPSLFPCAKHRNWANENRDGKTLHAVLH